MKNEIEICSEQCNQCLFSKNKIVSNERRKEILNDCQRTGKHFECHKGTIAGRKIICKGFYDNKADGLLLYANHIGILKKINPNEI